MPKGTKLTRGIRRAKGNKYNIIDKVRDAFNKPKNNQDSKATTRQVAHKMPDAKTTQVQHTSTKPTEAKTTRVVNTRPTTPATPATTAAPTPVMSESEYKHRFRNSALAVMQAKRTHYARPEHLANYAASGDLGEGLDRIRLQRSPGRGDGTSYRDYDVVAIQDDGSARISSFADYKDAGIKDAININFGKYRDQDFVDTDPIYQRFRTNYGRRDDKGQDESYINYNPNTNKFSIFDHGKGQNTNYFEDIPALLKAGQKMSYRRNQ